MSKIEIGQTVQLGDGTPAIVRFVGQTAFAQGDWVGVELEDPNGKNDGTIQGHYYFECAPGHGMFVRPNTVTIIEAAPQQAAPARRPSRPSSTVAGARPGSTSDPSMAKRISLNAPSPSPASRTSRPSGIGRSTSPVKSQSPIKQVSSTSSTANSRTTTPSNARTSSIGARSRLSISAGTRISTGSMAPPALPPNRVSRQPSTSSSSGTRTTGAVRGHAARLSTAGRGGTTRPVGGRVRSGDSLSGIDMSSGSGNRSGIASPVKSDGEQTTSPVRTRTNALEKLTAPAASAPKTSRAVSSSTRPAAANNANARKIADLESELKVMRQHRDDDQKKLRDLSRLQTENERILNIQTKIDQKCKTVQQENVSLQKQLKEAQDDLEKIEAIQAEHDSIMELATLDREMAEESADVLKVELEALKQKVEELELEVEVLREENAEYEQNMTPEDRANTNWIQLERNNERLREALIRLRDISREQDEDAKAHIKALEKDLEEFDTVKEQYDIAKEKILETETRAEDLREQLDNALGAEDMIEQLTEAKMNQQEQIEELKAALDDLETLKEINDELEINHIQNEKEMQEDLDFKDSVIAEQVRKARQQDENIEDLEYTLSRFRELVTSLQTDLEDMRASHAVNEVESEQLTSKSRAMMDLNLKLQISAAKTQAKTIDLEIQRMESQEAKQHLEIVKLFLPESYEADKNSVLALLRFKRLAFKANLLHGLLSEIVSSKPHPGHEDDIFAGCDALDKLTWVSSMCDRFVNAISHCSLQEFARYEGALFELEPVERALNSWIDGLKKEEFKEKQCANELSRTVALMSHLGEVHISDSVEGFADSVQMQTVLMQSHLESAATSFAVLKDMVQRVVPNRGDDDELVQHFSKKVDAVISQTRGAKVVVGKAVRSLADLKTRHLCLMPETAEGFEQCEATSRELADMSRKIGVDLHALTSEEGRVETITYLDVLDTIKNTAMSSFSSSETDLFSTYLSKVRVLTSQISDLAAVCADLSQTQEFDRCEVPWKLRAQELKAVKTMPVDAEEELRQIKENYNEARRVIASSEEKYTTAQLKIETLEARMEKFKEKSDRVTELETKLEEAKVSRTQLEEDRDKQDRELKALEDERAKLQKIVDDSQAFGDAAGEAGAKAGQERAVATAREMDVLKNDIASLQAAVRYLREDNRRARLTEQHKFDWLAEPLKKSAPITELRKALVATEGKDALSELLKMATSAKVFDLKSLPDDKIAWRPAKSTPQYHAAKQAEEFATWKSWQSSVVQKAQVVLHTQTGKRPEFDHDKMKKAAARLQIRLPDFDGKMIPSSGRDVQIVGSRDWEGLQGRLAVA